MKEIVIDKKVKITNVSDQSKYANESDFKLTVTFYSNQQKYKNFEKFKGNPYRSTCGVNIPISPTNHIGMLHSSIYTCL